MEEMTQTYSSSMCFSPALHN